MGNFTSVGEGLNREVRSVMEEHWKVLDAESPTCDIAALARITPFMWTRVERPMWEDRSTLDRERGFERFFGQFPLLLLFEQDEAGIPVMLQVNGDENSDKVWTSFRFRVPVPVTHPNSLDFARRLSVDAGRLTDVVFAWADKHDTRQRRVNPIGVDGHFFGWDTPVVSCPNAGAVRAHLEKVLRENAVTWEYVLGRLLDQPEMVAVL